LREKRGLRVFEKRVLRGMFGPKRDEMTGVWRKFHNEELHDLNSSPIIVRVIKSRSMRWAGNVTRMEEGRDVYRVLVGKPKEKRYLIVRDVDGRIILRWIFRKRDLGVWNGLRWLKIETGGGHLGMR
jgi:hypothetical protein